MDPEIRECVARAVFELVSDFGLSCDKERIKEDLFLDHLHLNTDSDINRRVIKLRVNNTTKAEYVDVEVKIVNVKAKVGEDFQFICPPCHLKDMKMILHCDIGEPMVQKFKKERRNYMMLAKKHDPSYENYL